MVEERERGHVTARIDWPGLSMFVLAVSVGVAVILVVTLEMTMAMQDASVVATAITGVLGAMIGAVSTFAGGGGFGRPVGRHRQDAGPSGADVSNPADEEL